MIRVVKILTAVVALALAIPSSVSAQAELHVMLTNDDGVAAQGLQEMRTAFLMAGHRVTVVAPDRNRSGSSSSQTTGGTVRYSEESDGVWSIDGTPADAVIVGLVHLLRNDPPDVVVSGSNFGQNAGANVLGSGTVGAALTAAERGVPAIAVSVAVEGLDDFTPAKAALTNDAFAPAADFVVGLVERLVETGGGGLLPPRIALNVNYPAVGGQQVSGVRFAPVSALKPFRHRLTVSESESLVRIRMTPADPNAAEPESDFDLLARGFITISVLDGDLDVDAERWESLLERLAIER